MNRDLFKSVDEFCSGLRRRFVDLRARSLPADLEWTQDCIHQKEDELRSLRQMEHDRLAGLVQMLLVEDGGALRPLNDGETRDMLNSLMAISCLRDREILIGPRPIDERKSYRTGKLVLDRSRFLLGDISGPPEQRCLADYADDIEALRRRIDAVALGELAPMRDQFEQLRSEL